MLRKIQLRTLLLVFVGCFFYSQVAFAQWTFSLSGTEDKSHGGLVVTTDSRWSASISVFLLQYMSLGISHSQVYKKTEGQKQISSTTMYENFEENVRVKKYAVNLTLVLFSGPVTPFIFGGIARKWLYYDWYYETSAILGSYEDPDNGKKNLWNAGIGFSIPVNYNFSIKIKRSWSEGYTLDSETQERKKEYDTYTEVGLTYKL